MPKLNKIRAYILADNKLAEKAGWDHSILAIDLQHLTSVDLEFDVSITGFEVGEVDLILQEAVAAEGQEEKEPVEIRSGPAVTQRGDVWLLGDHRLICGDALDESTYSVLMKGQKAHAVFADPPYNVKIDGNVCGKGKIHHREFVMAAGEMSEPEFVDFLCSALFFLHRHSCDGSVHFICMDWRHAAEILEAGRKAYDRLLNLCVWTKDNGGMGSFYRSQHELIFVFRNGKEPHRNNVKWIKQHLRIKAFYGTSENAVKTQIWIAVSVYVLVAIVRKRLGLEASLYQTLQILSVTLFEKTPILCALQALDAGANFAENVNQLILFDI